MELNSLFATLRDVRGKDAVAALIDGIQSRVQLAAEHRDWTELATFVEMLLSAQNELALVVAGTDEERALVLARDEAQDRDTHTDGPLDKPRDPHGAVGPTGEPPGPNDPRVRGNAAGPEDVQRRGVLRDDSVLGERYGRSSAASGLPRPGVAIEGVPATKTADSGISDKGTAAAPGASETHRDRADAAKTEAEAVAKVHSTSQAHSAPARDANAKKK